MVVQKTTAQYQVLLFMPEKRAGIAVALANDVFCMFVLSHMDRTFLLNAL